MRSVVLTYVLGVLLSGYVLCGCGVKGDPFPAAPAIDLTGDVDDAEDGEDAEDETAGAIAAKKKK